MRGDLIEHRESENGLRAVRRAAQRGFTLVEMAIVLVIIGLIIGGILKGQEIVDNARVKSQVSQIDGIKAAISTFVDEYNYFPGDDPNAVTQIGVIAGTNGNGDGFVSPNAGAGFADNVAAGAGEVNWVWYHLQTAQLLTGIPLQNSAAGVATGAVAAANLFTYQGKLASSYLYYGDMIWNATVENKMIRIQGNNSYGNVPTPAVRVADANQIDTKYDDGVPGTGNILAAEYSNAANCCNGAACTAAGAAYGLPAGASSASPYCGLLWLTE